MLDTRTVLSFAIALVQCCVVLPNLATPSEVSLLDSAKPSWWIALRVRPSRFALVQCCVVLPNLVQFLNHVLDVNELKPLRVIEKQKRETTFRN